MGRGPGRVGGGGESAFGAGATLRTLLLVELLVHRQGHGLDLPDRVLQLLQRFVLLCSERGKTSSVSLSA